MPKGCGFRYGRSRSEYPADHPYRAHGALVRFYEFAWHAEAPRRAPLRGWEHRAPDIDKNLAPALETINERQLGVLLEAIHLGDGDKQLGQYWTRRSYHITTANRAYADRLQSLCIRRGFRCNVSFRRERLMVLHIKEGTVATGRCRLPRPCLARGGPAGFGRARVVRDKPARDNRWSAGTARWRSWGTA